MTEFREYRTVDKTAWGVGPWQGEPDKRQWTDEATGMPCLIVRNPGGALCGYVGVSMDHPAHGLNYNAYSYDDAGHAIPTSLIEDAVNDIEVHGGLTFAAGCGHGDDESVGICHIPAAGEPDDVWWFGFDCLHSGDVGPAYAARERAQGWEHVDPPWGRDKYRDVAYVTAECARLAVQLRAMVTP